jgi:CheY-like chemotaxis protein
MSDKKKVLEKFLKDNRVLIVDKNPGSRNRLIKIICDLGAKLKYVHATSRFSEAVEIVETEKISLVLSDYFVDGGSGFDLFKILRERKPENKNMCFVLVTSNISQTAVAKAAEEDVDAFVVKPYTIEAIQDYLMNAVFDKVQPSEYSIKIDQAKTLMTEGELDKALLVLRDAVSNSKKPSLALFYIGQIEYMRNMTTKAQQAYDEGLSVSRIHFKCLFGLYDLYMREKKHKNAYKIAKKITKYYPANPERLTQVIRLAIQTENYQDMQSYYEVFTTLEERPPILTNYIGAGLYVSGKHFIKRDKYEEAIKCFDSIGVSCSESTKLIRGLITVLCEHSHAVDAEKFLQRFSAGSRDHEDYLVSEYLVWAGKGAGLPFLVKNGLELYNKNIRDVLCMKTLVNAMEQSGYKQEKIDEFRNEINVLWPEEPSV